MKKYLVIVLMMSGGIIYPAAMSESQGSLNALDQFDFTPLMDAINAGRNIDYIRNLVDRGAIVNIQNSVGDTALMMAARNDNGAVIELLLERGADSLAEDNEGYKAIDYTRDPALMFMIAADMKEREAARVAQGLPAAPRGTFRPVPVGPSGNASPEMELRRLASPSPASSRPESAVGPERAGSSSSNASASASSSASPEMRQRRSPVPITHFTFSPSHQMQSEHRQPLNPQLMDYDSSDDDDAPLARPIEMPK
jgi:hypothetical protein